ncbi:hypothetical protein BGZ98_007455 [Dissophora globulifera]|nr:hypothetical protein BGZ98_007455 [Dissophora globulifera]
MADNTFDIPAIDGIFVVRFDTRRGNVLEWSETTPGVQLDGVEFSALPSGLHNSSQDVIYFQLDGCIGVSVFVNLPSSSVEQRGALMVSVGVLVKPCADTGRCGQVWRHVAFLKSQAKFHAALGSDTGSLASYFAQHKTLQYAAGPSSPSTSKRDSYRARNMRRISRSFTLSEPVQALSHLSNGHQDSMEAIEIPSSHPSHHFLRLVQTMGPSIYLLWKAALLKKRILIYTPLPIEAACLSVYNICLMATIPFGATSSAMVGTGERIQPLFCVGIHDLDHMENIQSGYVACTTDKVFLYKPQVYDVLVDLSTHSHPRIRVAHRTLAGHEVEERRPNAADNRRYFTLLQQLGRYRRKQEWMQRQLYAEAATHTVTDEDLETEAIMDGERDGIVPPTQSGTKPISTGGFDMSDTLRKMLTGGWWWWYGGDESDEDENLHPSILKDAAEQSQEARARDTNSALTGARLQVLQARTSVSSDTEAIRFFHNLTSTVLSELGRLISFKMTAAIFDDEDDPSTAAVNGQGASRVVLISQRDMRELGLDPCKDSEFVDELGRFYFGTSVRQKDSGLGMWCSSVSSFCPCCYPLAQ